jgi:hypothetical protein
MTYRDDPMGAQDLAPFHEEDGGPERCPVCSKPEPCACGGTEDPAIEGTVDVTVEGHGTVHLFHLRTDRARMWVAECVAQPATFYGGALVVEHRYVQHVVQGMSDDGLEVE